MILDQSKKSYLKQSDDRNWSWWPLFPLYPYGRKKTLFKELIANQIWSFEQLQGIYYVAVPIRMTVIKTSTGLMLINPVPPTKELLEKLSQLVNSYGPVSDIVLPTASGLEHKIALPALSRAFPNSKIWICPGQWSFPFDLPLQWLGLPKKRTKILFDDGVPLKEEFNWNSLGPIDIGLGRFQEISCFHKATKSLLVTDALVGIDDVPPEIFSFDPTPLLFHSREKGSEKLIDTPEARVKGWKRLVLFASFLKPSRLSIPKLADVLKNSFNVGLRNKRSHYGIYPFKWSKDWEISSNQIVGKDEPMIQIAPVLERLVFPRAKESYLEWLNNIINLKDIKWLISAHYSAPVKISEKELRIFLKELNERKWAPGGGDWNFLDVLDKNLLKLGIVPKNPKEKF